MTPPPIRCGTILPQRGWAPLGGVVCCAIATEAKKTSNPKVIPIALLILIRSPFPISLFGSAD